MLSHANLARLSLHYQGHDFSRDLVQEYLDSLLRVESFEPLEESKDCSVMDSSTAVKAHRPRSKHSKKAKSQSVAPSEISKPSEKSKPSSSTRRHKPKPPWQHKHDAPTGHTIPEELEEGDPTSEATNGRKSTVLPVESKQCENVAKRVPKSRTKKTTEQSGAVERKAQESVVADTGPTQPRNKSRDGRRVKQRYRCKQQTQGQGQGQAQEQGQGVMKEQLQDEPRSPRDFEVHAQTDKTETNLLSPRKNVAEERVIDENSQPGPTAARTGNRNWHKKSKGRQRHGESNRGGKGRNCSLEAGSASMRHIANEDKGQTRFAPKLKARPNRNKTAPSEDGTPAPTPSLSGSDAGSFGASLLEADAGPSSAAISIPTGASNTVEKDLSSRRLSAVSAPAAAAPMSPPSNFTRPTATPKSPTFSPTKPQKEKPTQQGTAISFPTTSDKSASEASSSASTTAGKPIVVGSSKPAKGASIISVPTARTHTERDEEEEEENLESSATSRKRSKGKHVVRNRTRESSHIEEGEDLTEDGDDEVPDYSDTYMHEFTKDMGTGRRSKVYFELLKLEEEKRRLKRQRRRERARLRAKGVKGDIDREHSATPGPAEDEVDELTEEYEEQVSIKQDEKEVETKREPSAPAQQPTNKTLAPQVRVVDGRIELDQDSLMVDHDLVDAVEDQGPMEYVEESALTKFVNSSSYSTKQKSEKWSEEDTERFYQAISQWGTDFGIIFRLFPGKSRVGVRNKFKREDRINHKRVEEALNRRAGMDLKQYSQVTNKEFPEVDEATMFKKKPEDEEDLLPDLSFADEYREDDEELEGVEKEEEPQEEEETEEIVGMVDG
ncbi:Transcription factor TFIIIB component B [Mortierella alpina]|nr:Transcription factor TFIIIB component B [Mortierella alpina]